MLAAVQVQNGQLPSFFAAGGNVSEIQRERERGRDGCEMLSEQGADEVEAVEISREIKPYFHQHGNVTTSTMTEGESIICKGNRFD